MNFLQLPKSLLPFSPDFSKNDTESIKSLFLNSASLVGRNSAGDSPLSSVSNISIQKHDHGITGQKVIEEIGITDKELINIKTKHLNNLLKGVSKERQKEIKSERRTYKNRIYADNCRKKRLVEKEELEIFLKKMAAELEKNKRELHNNRYKIMELIKSSDSLLRSLDQYESGSEMKAKIKEKILNENPPIRDQTKEIFDKLGQSNLPNI